MNAPSDRDLIQHARRGDGQAFGELVRRYQTSVFNVCFRILHERAEAEDVAQESFVRGHERLNTFDVERDADTGQWPGLREGQLIGPGDLAVTTDYRDVLSEILTRRLNNEALNEIFPNYAVKMRGIFK
jgi:hypothetical protein